MSNIWRYYFAYSQKMEDDFKVQKRGILDFVKGITNDLIQGSDLQKPDKLGDKVLHAAFLNLRGCLADIIDESRNLKKKNKDFHTKVDNLIKTVSSLKDDNYNCKESIEKLRDDIDLKESNERILQHQLKQCKESYKDNETKLAINLKEYDNLANEMKSQIEFLEQKNKKLSGTVDHLQDKRKRERYDIEREKEELYQTQVTCNKNIANYERKKSRVNQEKYDLEKAKEQLRTTQIIYQNDIKDFENRLAKFQEERSSLNEEQFDLQRQKSDLQREISDLQRQKLDLDRERSDLELEKSDVQGEKYNVEREKEELYQAQVTYQREMKYFEKAHAKLEYEKEELRKTLTKLIYEKDELKKAREKLQTEEQNCEDNIEEFQEKILRLTEHVCQDRKKKKDTNFQDKLTNQLLKSLAKVETLQDDLEERMKELESPNVTATFHDHPNEVPVTMPTPLCPFANLQSTHNPVQQAIPVISTIPLPIHPDANPANNIHNTNNMDRSCMNPAPLSYNDLSPYSNQLLTPTRRHDTRNVSFKSVNSTPAEIVHPSESDGHMFCNIKEHTKKNNNNNVKESNDVLLQRKLEKLEESRNDIKWDLCRLEAKVGDAVLKRSLYNNMRAENYL